MKTVLSAEYPPPPYGELRKINITLHLSCGHTKSREVDVGLGDGSGRYHWLVGNPGVRARCLVCETGDDHAE